MFESQQTAQDEAKKILDNLIQAVNVCQRKYGGKKELASESDEIILELLDCWENVIDFGLKKSPAIPSSTSTINLPNSITDVIRNVQDIFSDLSTYTTSEQVLWNMIQNHLTNHERERFDNLKYIWTDSGRIRAFLRNSLNEHSLNRYILMLLSDSNLPKIYQSYSLLVDAESTNLLPSIASGLDSILFAITFDSPDLNRPRQRDKRLEPIISVPHPIQPIKKLAAIERNIMSLGIESSSEEVVDAVKYLDAQEIIQSELTTSNPWSKEISAEESKKKAGENNESGEIIENNLSNFTNVHDFKRNDSYISEIDNYLKTLNIPGLSNDDPRNSNNISSNEAEIDECDDDVIEDGKGLNKIEIEYDSDEASSIVSKSTSTSSQLNNFNQNNPNHIETERKIKILEEQLKTMTEKCSFLEARIAELSLENKRLQRYGNFINNDFGNYNITIPKVNLIISKHSKHYEYEIHIQSKENESWMISKRYSEFYRLHNDMLKKQNALVKVIDFPPKKKIGNLNAVFVEERRLRLQTYLRSLLEVLPEIILCTSKQELQETIDFFR